DSSVTGVQTCALPILKPQALTRPLIPDLRQIDRANRLVVRQMIDVEFGGIERIYPAPPLHRPGVLPRIRDLLREQPVLGDRDDQIGRASCREGVECEE